MIVMSLWNGYSLVALRELLPTGSWNAITEISQFFRDLCTSTIRVDSMERLENNIAEIICKLEKIFPSSFFNSMEHLPIHLPYEAKVGGLVQYRWMYPFERFLNHIKRKIGNKARVEGSIYNSFLLEEIANFCSLYFESHNDTKAKDLDAGVNSDDDLDSIKLPELFNTDMGTTTGKCIQRYLGEKEYEEVHFYVLRNCGKFLESYEKEFETHIKLTFPDVTSSDDVWSKHDKSYPKWFRNEVSNTFASYSYTNAFILFVHIFSYGE
ncbi:uncharacterized protein LOC141623353 [Silene latifolia]|uniref:uncharacterized protein LOC141623353 n=1 Tax=Silene latifolia TaxID=37657 RepID=UPI003D774E17